MLSSDAEATKLPSLWRGTTLISASRQRTGDINLRVNIKVEQSVFVANERGADLRTSSDVPSADSIVQTAREHNGFLGVAQDLNDGVLREHNC